MAKPTGFMEFGREDAPHRPVGERVGDSLEIELPLGGEALLRQAARCMDCGIPFCHGVGCPVHNRMPEFNDLVHRGRWREASEVLHATNNFPEFTGRICPAPCETACTLAINDDPVNIKHIELQIVERAFAEGWIEPMAPQDRTGKRVAIVGSGPAGLAAAQQLARAGHDVTVFEKDDRIGGLLRYGIPDFKLAKSVIDRRLDQLAAEGVHFEPSVHVGKDISARYLRRSFEAICLAMGAGLPRDLDVPGRRADNVHFAMDYLTRQNRIVSGDPVPPDGAIDAKDKLVVVLGGGDTGSDCVGTARRQGAREIIQLEILPRPPEQRPASTPWPTWPMVLRTSSSHEEGCRRRWGVLTTRLTGNGSLVRELHGVEVARRNGQAGVQFEPLPGSEFSIQVDLVLLAMGFLHVEPHGLVEELGLKRDGRGNVRVDGCMTGEPSLFAAGDTVIGASLVVRAIQSGRDAAAAIDRWLMG